jgi:hypothetical protein
MNELVFGGGVYEHDCFRSGREGGGGGVRHHHLR